MFWQNTGCVLKQQNWYVFYVLYVKEDIPQALFTRQDENAWKHSRNFPEQLL